MDSEPAAQTVPAGARRGAGAAEAGGAARRTRTGPEPGAAEAGGAGGRTRAGPEPGAAEADGSAQAVPAATFAGEPDGSAQAVPAATFAGEPDGFDRLWVPQRMAYVGGDSRPHDGRPDDCPFCLAPAKPDPEALIVARGLSVYAILNLFPYNPGHLLICPYRHVAALTDLDGPESVELTEFSQHALRALTRAKQPQGFNLGINQGSQAGAGIAAHLHQHIVPRWTGDSNFFPLIAHSRALPELLSATREAVAGAWSET